MGNQWLELASPLGILAAAVIILVSVLLPRRQRLNARIAMIVGILTMLYFCAVGVAREAYVKTRPWQTWTIIE